MQNLCRNDTQIPQDNRSPSPTSFSYRFTLNGQLLSDIVTFRNRRKRILCKSLRNSEYLAIIR